MSPQKQFKKYPYDQEQYFGIIALIATARFLSRRFEYAIILSTILYHVRLNTYVIASGARQSQTFAIASFHFVAFAMTYYK